jgi:ArsR family transcriptional regulator, arsenate/arsenite/antimonite-responsive transcriptional repressor
MKNIVKVFKALSDATRLRIVLLLAERNLCVCELVFILKMEQSRISHQLRILRDADLVEDIREGRWIIYRIPEAVRGALKPLLERFAGGKLAESQEALRDLEALDICLREEVRKKRGPAGVERI